MELVVDQLMSPYNVILKYMKMNFQFKYICT